MISKDFMLNYIGLYEMLDFENLKISYFMLKPNSNKHYKNIIEEIKKDGYEILGQFAVMDYENVTLELHKKQPDAIKYLRPINRMYKDFYGNYAIIVLVGKRFVSYENFCFEVNSFKQYIRKKYDMKYIAYVFNTVHLGEKNQNQRIIILSEDDKEVSKNRFNNKGTYMLFFTNEIHSPDEKVESTIEELMFLVRVNVIVEENYIPQVILKNIERYSTFEFLKDMI